MKRFTLALALTLLMSPLLMQAQLGSVGLRAGFNGAPGGLTGQYFMTERNAIEMHLGHTDWKGDAPMMQRGALAIGGAYQRYIYVGDNDNASGFYGQAGSRLRMHLGNIHRAVEGKAGGTGTQKMTIDAYGGGGVFVRIAQTVEIFAEVNMGFGSPRGSKYGLMLDTGLGARLLLW